MKYLQIGGDMDPLAYDGLFGCHDDDWIHLVRIQNVRNNIGRDCHDVDGAWWVDRLDVHVPDLAWDKFGHALAGMAGMDRAEYEALPAMEQASMMDGTYAFEESRLTWGPEIPRNLCYYNGRKVTRADIRAEVSSELRWRRGQ